MLMACAGVLFLAACDKAAPPAPPPPTVDVISVVQKDVPIYREWVGVLDGDVNATIRPQVTGYLIKQNYREGDTVKKGQVLFEIDPRTFQAAFDQAAAARSKQQAIAATAAANLARIKPLAEKNAVSQKDLDDAVGSDLSARAALDHAKKHFYDVLTAGSADAVLTFRNVHNWVADDSAEAYFRAFFAVLKPGGTLGVVDHRAKPGTALDAMKKSGYLTEALVIDLATRAGFTLVASSQVNANPKDDADHPNGVWTLPPSNRHDAADKAAYQAIGESDRMTLRFRKPA